MKTFNEAQAELREALAELGRAIVKAARDDLARVRRLFRRRRP